MLHLDSLVDYFRCPVSLTRVDSAGTLSERKGYFTFRDAICFGQLSNGSPSADADDWLIDAFDGAVLGGDSLRLPFDFQSVVNCLRHEEYHQNGYSFRSRLTSGAAAQHLYYLFRPLLKVGIRKHLQKIRLSDWQEIAFPKWPVDTSVDTLMRETLGLLIRHNGVDRIPFVWFWPDGADCTVVMTHDVEGSAGRAFCGRLMDLDDSYGVKSAFQLIPQGHERTLLALAARLRARGFEVNLHDLNHDGYLFRSRRQFLRRAKEINRYAREFHCRGFRAGAMYREQRWFDAFEFDYDMSVPNVAHLEPQRGGCCTVMPYFIGDILELPLTTIQDYSLFHILNDYSITLWQRQFAAIRQRNGLATFLAHPDYLVDPPALDVYESLLAHLQEVREESRVWVTLPGDLNRWWRDRQRMTLVPNGSSWRIEGPEADRARLAYATLEGNQVRYVLAEAA